jgi:predicted Zn-dependent protease
MVCCFETTPPAHVGLPSVEHSRHRSSHAPYRAGFKAQTVYDDLADVLSRAGREAEAINPLRRGIELSPYTPVLHKSLALRYINLRRYEEA